MIAIILAASIEAAKQLGGGTIAIFLAQVTELGGKVIFGTLIIVVGIFLARIVANLVGSGTGEGGFAQTIVRYAIIALFTAIGLTFMGLADQIVILAFGLILGSAAVATALAFGLGGRDAAARSLERWADGTGRPARPRSAAANPPGSADATSSRRWSDDLRRGRRLRADASRTERGTSYGKPAVKVASNGRAFLFPSHEPDTSFGSRSTSTRSRCSRRPTRTPFGKRRTTSAGKAC